MDRGLFALGLSFAFAVFVLSASTLPPPTVEADASQLVVSPQAAVGNTVDITFQVNDEAAVEPGSLGGDVTLVVETTSPSSGVGHFVGATILSDDGDDCAPSSGLGTDTLTWLDSGCLDTMDFDEVSETVSGSVDFLCTRQGTVQFRLEQDGSDPLEGPSFVASCSAPTSTPVKLTLEMTSEIDDEVTQCPSTVRIEARVLDVDDDPIDDGSVINFVTRGATFTSGFAVVLGGFAETFLEIPADAPREIEVLATATVQGVSLKQELDIPVACGTEFAPTAVEFVLSSNTVECGTSAFIGGKVVDEEDVPAADGTAVKLIASKGGTLDPAETTTSGGMFTVTYKAPAAAVIDKVTVAVKGLFQSTDITVTCGGVTPSASTGAAGATGGAAGSTTSGSAAGTGASAGAGGTAGATASGAIRPPSTGGGGLKDKTSTSLSGAIVALGVLALAARPLLARQS